MPISGLGSIDMKRSACIYLVIYMSLAAAPSISDPGLLSVAQHEDAEAIINSGSNIDQESKPQECVIEEIDSGLESTVHSRQVNSTIRREHELRVGGDVCLISAEQVIERMQDSHPSIIDLRLRSEWMESHIPGSINMRPSELAMKGFLRHASLVLVDKGYDPYALETICLGLREAGFSDVTSVIGGVAAWQSIAPMRQVSTSLDAVYGISADEFISALHSNSWLIAGIDVDQETLNNNFVGLNSMVFDGRMSSISESLLAAGWPLQSGNKVAVLLISPDGKHYPEVQVLKDFYKFGRVYYLKGGLSAYEAYTLASNKMIAHLKREPELVKKCGR